MRVLIAGAGIGGLATAIALQHRGIESVLIDPTPPGNEAAKTPGAGLLLWSNGVRVLRHLGVEEQVLTAGTLIEESVAMTRSARVLAHFDIGAIGREAGAASIGIRRAALQEILAAELSPGVVRQTSRCVSFAVRGNTVIAHMADGSTLNGDALVGADGLRSAVHEQLRGAAEKPRYAGYTCWQGIERRDAKGKAAGGAMLSVLGQGSQGWLSPCGEGMSYWCVTRNAPPRAALEQDSLADRWPEPLAAAIRATDPSDISRLDIADRPAASKWGAGPVTLLGDAAHPSTPNLCQGACQALEDAQALAACLHGAASPEQGLRIYEHARMARTASITNDAWRLGLMLQTEHFLGVAARDFALSTSLGRRFVGKRLRQMLRG